MLINCEQSFVCNTQENMEGIADHTSSFNGDVGLPYRMCPVQADEGCLAFGYAKDQSRLIRHCDHFTTFFCMDVTIMSSLRALPACSYCRHARFQLIMRLQIITGGEGLFYQLPCGCTCGFFKSSEIHDYIPGFLITFVPADLPVLFKESLGHCAIAGVHSTFVQ